MLIRVRGDEGGRAAQAVKAAMRIRMRLAGLCDHTYWWQSSHPDNPRADKERLEPWFARQLDLALGLRPEDLVAPLEVAAFDAGLPYRLWSVPKWPTDKLIGKRVRADGTFPAAKEWTDRLIASVQKHGILDPIIAVGHVASTVISDGVALPPGTPNVVLGNNRIAVAKHLKIPSVWVILSLPTGKTPPFPGEEITFEDLHARQPGDLWVTETMWQVVHPPTRFHDEKDNREPVYDEISERQLPDSNPAAPFYD